MKKIFVTRPIQSTGIEMLRNEGYRVVVRNKKTVPSKKELQAAVASYDALLCLLTDHIDKDVIRAAGAQLVVISNFAVGYDNIDIASAKKRGIVVANTPCDEVSDAVADHTIALIFALERRIVAADTFVRKGKYACWDPMIFVGEGITGKTVGLLGLGRIGKSVAQRLEEGFKTRILYHDVRRDEVFEKKYNAVFVEQEELLKKSDIVSLHVPLLPSTRHLINTKALRAMKKGALLVNTSRGAIVDQHAVLTALAKGWLGGFATDVYECEPSLACLARDARAFLKNDRCVFTPHIASATLAARTAMSRIAAQNIIDVFHNRRPPTAVS
ncbi:MAG: D-glycerate dehydrogenase [Patescibacteria group bacterium]